MSQFTKSLEKRIQELTESIDAQKTELTAYERVLHMELSKGSVPEESISVAEDAPSEASPQMPARKKRGPAKSAPAVTGDAPAKANKTSMVAEVVKSFGTEGATPKDVDAYFTAKNIERSKNLVYNTLSYLVAQNKLSRRDGKYFAEAGGATSAKKKPGRKPGVVTKTAPVKSAATKTTTKRRLSPEGLQRIKDALKKRWADKKAAEQSGLKSASKSATKKK